MGVVLELQRVSGMVIADAQRKLKVPKPPLVPIYDEETGKKIRDEENDSDPDYLEEVQRFQFKSGDLTSKVYMMLGTKIKSVPESMYTPEQDGWIEELKELE